MTKVRKPYAQPWWEMREIKQVNQEMGFYFFEPGAMRFFNSRVGSAVHQGPGGIYFVTSEQFVPSEGPPAKRRYTVRQFNPKTGDVATAGMFQEFESAAGAAAYAKRLASQIGGQADPKIAAKIADALDATGGE